jgi:outer membrane lipoprotein-sorting protein
MAAIQRHARLTVVLMLVALVVAAPAIASPSRDILDRRKALDDGERRWNDREQHISLTITTSRGGERHREIVVYERRLKNDERQTVIFFEEPAEVRGTAFLSLSRPGKTAEQWLYLPALKRVRQITAQTRTQSFVGTDLSYQDLDIIQDMPSWTEEDAPSELIRDEVLDGVPTHVIGLSPHRDDVGYQRIVLWLGADDLVMRRLEFFEDGPDPVKRIEQKKIETIGKIPVAHRLEIERPQRGSHTVMEVRGVTFDQNLEDDLFTQRALERGER